MGRVVPKPVAKVNKPTNQLQKGENPGPLRADHEDAFGQTCLVYACKEGQAEIVRWLLQVKKLDVVIYLM